MNKHRCCKHCTHNHGQGHKLPCNMCVVEGFKEQGKQHVFEPYNAGWAKPRCKVCQEFEDHPIHIKE